MREFGVGVGRAGGGDVDGGGGEGEKVDDETMERRERARHAQNDPFTAWKRYFRLFGTRICPSTPNGD